MPLQLPPDLRPTLQPLFESLPFDQAMPELVSQPGDAAHAEGLTLVQQWAEDDRFRHRHDLLAGLYLYVDDLDAAHIRAQDDATPTGSFWHAVVHRREGDFDNAKYWYAKASNHPAMSHIDLTGGGAGSGTDVAAYDPDTFVDQVRQNRTDDERDAKPALLSAQRKEWKALFEWCAGRRA
jgi:hypothetical protein